MENKSNKIITFSLLFVLATLAQAQSVSWTSSTEGQYIKQQSIKLSGKASQSPIISMFKADQGFEFKAWGTTFNELNWDALQLLPEAKRKEILDNLFSPTGQLRFTRGRIGMNANDYARSWFSCDEVDGDFQLKYFNINRDKEAIIPYIKEAQKRNPDISFWISPWSPPSWMKINHHYAVQSNKYNDLNSQLDFLLYEDSDRSHNEQVNPDKNLFPRRLAVNDYFIQDPRYLQAYANYFCRFIEAYQAEGIPITMVMYQNEAYSYTAYPGCPWTPEGAIRFNMEYLGPTLRQAHPEVALYMGTFNTNRYDNVKQILSDPRMSKYVSGVGFQWEGGQILPRIRKDFPAFNYISSESECGWGSFDWKSAEHTFQLINHYLVNGCNEYFNWNGILSDNGESAWGWKQNALIRVDSQSHQFKYTPEYYAYLHYSHFITPGSSILGGVEKKDSETPVLVARNPLGKYIVVAANLSDTQKEITVQLDKKFINATLPSHSFHTFQVR